MSDCYGIGERRPPDPVKRQVGFRYGKLKGMAGDRYVHTNSRKLSECLEPDPCEDCEQFPACGGVCNKEEATK